MEMCRWLLQGFTEIQNVRHGSTSIFRGGGVQKPILILTSHSLHMWMCKWFFKDTTKIKNGRLKPGHKTLKLNVWNYLNSNWLPCMNFIIVCGHKNSKIKVRNDV